MRCRRDHEVGAGHGFRRRARQTGAAGLKTGFGGRKRNLENVVAGHHTGWCGPVTHCSRTFRIRIVYGGTSVLRNRRILRNIRWVPRSVSDLYGGRINRAFRRVRLATANPAAISRARRLSSSPRCGDLAGQFAYDGTRPARDRTY